MLDEQYRNKDARRQENPWTKLQEDAGSKQLNSQRIDFNHILSDNMKLLAFAYRTHSDFTRFQSGLRPADIATAGLNPSALPATLPADFMDPNAPVNITQFAPQTEHVHGRTAMAFGASLNAHTSVFGAHSTWVLGTEYYNEEADVQRWNTVRRVRSPSTPGFDGLPREDNEFDIKTLSLYGQLDMDISPRFRPTLGFRYDNFDGSRDNRLPGGIKTDMNSYDHISPKLGVRSALNDAWELRASVANGFALPGGTAKYEPSVDVDNVEIWQYEIGINGAPSPQWYLDLAAFIIETSDEILQITPNVFENAGKTRRTGLEGEVRYFPASMANFEIFTAFGIYDSEVKENPGNTGRQRSQRSARHMANVGLRYAPPVGWGGSLQLRSLGSGTPMRVTPSSTMVTRGSMRPCPIPSKPKAGARRASISTSTTPPTKAIRSRSAAPSTARRRATALVRRSTPWSVSCCRSERRIDNLLRLHGRSRFFFALPKCGRK